MATDGHLSPSGDVENALHPLARWVEDFLWKPGIGQRRDDPLASDESKRLFCVLLVHPKRGRHVAGEPVDRDVGQQLVNIEPASDVIVTVAPGKELFEEPAS